MSIMTRQIQTIREQTKFKQIREDIASFVISDLEGEGFEPKLVKIKKVIGEDWKIIPKYTLTPEEQVRFDKIKNEQTEIYKEMKMDQLKEMRRALRG